MKSKLVKIQFCFPRISQSVKDKKAFVQSIVDMMQRNGSINYAGYLEDDDLQRDILMKIGSFNPKNYRVLTEEEKQNITRKINNSIQKSYKKLLHPEIPIFVFVFPWFPNPEDRNVFGGVDAVAVHESVMHLFIAPDAYTQRSLTETIAHEYNHLVFYHYQGAKKYTLLEHIFMEGLAENFREEVIGGKSAPWSEALNKKEAHKLFLSIYPLLQSKNKRVHEEVLFGSEKYKRWAGYSIGYWFIREFRKKQPAYSWQEVVQIKSEDLLIYINKRGATE